MASEVPTPEYLASVLVQFGRPLALYARTWCDSPDDVVQDALVELAARRVPPGNVRAWLYRVVRNGAISAGRRQRRWADRERRAAVSEVWFDSAAGQLDAREAAAALGLLAAELREVVVARIWGELTFAEIAELMNTSLSTAQRRYEHGLRELQARLEQPCATTERPPKS